MKVKFFERNGLLNLNAVYAGVYQFKVGVLDDDEEKYLPLYIGESYSMLSRCSNHLYEVFHTDPSYFGLTEENLEDDRLQLIVEIYESIPLEKDISNSERDIKLRQKETSAIKAAKPLSQNESNDNLRKDRVKVVQDAIDKLLSSR